MSMMTELFKIEKKPISQTISIGSLNNSTTIIEHGSEDIILKPDYVVLAFKDFFNDNIRWTELVVKDPSIRKSLKKLDIEVHDNIDQNLIRLIEITGSQLEEIYKVT